jgi:Mg2+-importing ATPase
MAAASAFLPFLPMLPRQILLLNFLSDLPSVAIAGDRVDEEDVALPRHWEIHSIRNFMVSFGLLSTAFDLATFAILLHVFHAGAPLFHTGWFVGSALTELAVLLVLRTRRVATRSRPGRALLVSSVAVALLTVLLPYLPVASSALGLVALPAPVLLTLLGITLAYVAAAELTKRVYYRAAAPAARLVPSRPAAAPHTRRLHRLAREHGYRDDHRGRAR